MRKQEADITPRVNRWVQSWISESTPFDVKHTRGANRFELREIADHQLDYMLAAGTEHGFIFKIEDAGYRHPPCDTVLYKNAKYAGFAIVFPTWTCYLLATDIERIRVPSITEQTAKSYSVQNIRTEKLPK